MRSKGCPVWLTDAAVWMVADERQDSRSRKHVTDPGGEAKREVTSQVSEDGIHGDTLGRNQKSKLENRKLNF